ncbi:kinase-like domain-containing protein [Paraphoma chrysanthemicola]|uniref:Kinase-like domain-containing protein n=1 Tax=Paraphoma chrysanthemicola TaxID=798071 RepID=A0A8K0RHF1_9PLEO|nr:kinase-like domain-containing protein [Paraphoma chrysanthemicola]
MIASPHTDSEMSRRSLFEPLKQLLRANSATKYRCDWCRERFENHVQLSNHLGGTEQITSEDKQECIQAYRCDWCEARFETHFGLSEHIRGSTRELILSGQECLPDLQTSMEMQSQRRDADTREECEAGAPETAGEQVPQRLSWGSATSDALAELVTFPKEQFDVSKSPESPRATTKVMASLVTGSNGIPQRFETMASTRSYATARTTSFASYRTAPSFSHRAISRSTLSPTTNHFHNPQLRSLFFYKDIASQSSQIAPHDEFVRRILNEADEHGWCPPDTVKSSTIELIFIDRGRVLVALNNISLETLALMAEVMVRNICDILFPVTHHRPNEWDKFRSVVARQVIDFIALVCNWVQYTTQLDRCFRQASTCPLAERSTDVSNSQWLVHLKTRGLLLDPNDELDWSGRGQHVEYDPKAERQIPLVFERPLGHSATALVDSVLCRRIRLARKRIRCTRALRKEDYIAEVEHLQHVQHAHILRVVGTYTFKRDLAILLYPVCPWNLDEFLDELVDPLSDINADAPDSQVWQERAGSMALRTAFGCLSHAMEYIHGKNVKHMDIKPKNILVRPLSDPSSTYKVYIADFGIARSYTSAADAETDSPVSFTRTYAAPEVALQDKRGFSADIFSLGCVFLEMFATLNSGIYSNERHRLFELRTSLGPDSSYHTNIEKVKEWFHEVSAAASSEFFLSERQLRVISRMMETVPADRPSAQDVDAEFAKLRCADCDSGSEPFEAARGQKFQYD